MGKKDKMGRPSASKQQQNMIPPRPKAPTEYQLPPILTREFTEEEVLEFREAFEIFDLDKGGTIDFDELKHVMTELGQDPTYEEIEEMIFACDTNGDGEIDFDEFLNLIRLSMGEDGGNAEEHLRDVFDLFDVDGSGYIDRDDMRLLMKRLAQDLTDDEITSIMEEVDTDGDGKISFEEFAAVCSS